MPSSFIWHWQLDELWRKKIPFPEKSREMSESGEEWKIGEIYTVCPISLVNNKFSWQLPRLDWLAVSTRVRDDLHFATFNSNTLHIVAEEMDHVTWPLSVSAIQEEVHLAACTMEETVSLYSTYNRCNFIAHRGVPILILHSMLSVEENRSIHN